MIRVVKTSRHAHKPMASHPKRCFTEQKIKIYTKTGDKGTSSLFNGERRSKADSVFDALGATDELSAQLGVVRATIKEKIVPHSAPRVYDLATKIQEIQERLLDIGSHIATPLSSSSENHIKRTAFSEEHTSKLEQDIDAMDKDLPALTNFIIPGSTVLSSHIHVCRAVCRRAERTTVVVAQNGNVTESVMKYLNRLSDWLFVAARFVAQAEEAEEIRYKKKKDQ